MNVHHQEFDLSRPDVRNKIFHKGISYKHN